jgi:hypothetical protein
VDLERLSHGNVIVDSSVVIGVFLVLTVRIFTSSFCAFAETAHVRSTPVPNAREYRTVRLVAMAEQ